VDNYSRSDDDCPILGQQIPILDGWIEDKEKSGNPYVILGDFNHRLSAHYNHATMQLHNNSDGSESTLENTTKDMLGCHPWYPAPNDHIFVGHMTEPGIKKEIVNHHYDNMEPDAMLADHCAITLSLTADTLSLTQAVKWLTISKEFAYITKSIYQEATEFLTTATAPKEPWVVVMDVDETILDNSQYQVERDTSGTRFNPLTWDEWVQREDATLVPGAKAFMEAVLAQGGKLALVTNRPRNLDTHTWKNLLAVGIPLTEENTCLMGRHADDKEMMGKDGIINDKDLRRQQIKNGSASCYKAGNTRHSDFGGHQIFMQVGDNIEDFAGVLQHDVNVAELLASSEGELVLLPNPMYGSWR
jgi:predicted secreted acid phosphatase